MGDAASAVVWKFGARMKWSRAGRRGNGGKGETRWWAGNFSGQLGELFSPFFFFFYMLFIFLMLAGFFFVSWLLNSLIRKKTVETHTAQFIRRKLDAHLNNGMTHLKHQAHT
jgi:hypothetical protein